MPHKGYKEEIFKLREKIAQTVLNKKTRYLRYFTKKYPVVFNSKKPTLSSTNT